MKNCGYILLLILCISCASKKSKTITKESKNYEDFFSYLETNYSGKDIVRDVWDKNIYIYNGSMFNNRDRKQLTDSKALNFINKHKVWYVEFQNNKIVIEFQSAAFIQRRSLLVKYLGNKDDGDDGEIRITDKIYFHKQNPITY